jgi:hypothetical protein
MSVSFPVANPGGPFEPGEAYKKCMLEIRGWDSQSITVQPNIAKAQLYAILSLEETLRNVAGQLEQLVAVISQPGR